VSEVARANGVAGALRLAIPISHYREKARRALDRRGVPYREERQLAGRR
jgi:hypothetical protein